MKEWGWKKTTGEGRKDHNTYINEYTAVLWAIYTAVCTLGLGIQQVQGRALLGHKRINT